MHIAITPLALWRFDTFAFSQFEYILELLYSCRRLCLKQPLCYLCGKYTLCITLRISYELSELPYIAYMDYVIRL